MLPIVGTAPSKTPKKRITITASGLDGSVRSGGLGGRDGFVYFGFHSDESPEDVCVCDYLLRKNETIDSSMSNAPGRHFQISYDINSYKYYIKDLKFGSGTFEKLLLKR